MSVETPAVVLQKSRPEYPEAASAAGVQGTVGVEVTVADTGSVVEARVMQSIPELDAAAVRSIRNWRFRPATRDDVAIESKLYVTVAFSLTPRPQRPA
jgi:protein TonB